jgi:thioredoxin reductase
LPAPALSGTVEAMESETYDVVVVGGGAAGLSAALVLGRARRRVAVIDAGTPRNAPATHMHGFLSRDGMPPADLLEAARGEGRTVIRGRNGRKRRNG